MAECCLRGIRRAQDIGWVLGSSLQLTVESVVAEARLNLGTMNSYNQPEPAAAWETGKTSPSILVRRADLCKHEALSLCRFNAGPTSATLGRH